MNRRRFLGTVLGTSVSLFVIPNRAGAAPEEQLLYCTWRRTGATKCDYTTGTLLEHWEYVCCEGIGCEVWNEEWRPIGSC